MTLRFLAALAASTALAACTLAPAYQRPALPVSAHWPVDAPPPAAPGPLAVDLGWRDVFPDPRLRAVIALALAQNRDLRVAVANIERERAQYRVQRAALVPTIDATGSQLKSRTPAGVSGFNETLDVNYSSATLGISNYELDLFGRVRSLTKAAQQSYFASEQDRRTAQISLISEVVADYLTLAADQDLLKLSRQTSDALDSELNLNQRRFEAGAASQLDLTQAQTLAEQAHADAATAAARVGQDQDALRLVIGADPPAELLPDGGLADIAIVHDLRPGLPSEVLAKRPDVLSAEYALKAQNANIGAARAAFFPQISLTGSGGSASADLNTLFRPGTSLWSFAPQISLPLFAGGANIANLSGARASRDAAVAQYEKAVQIAFRDVADTLAVSATIHERIASEERLVAAATQSEQLSQARYDRGVDGYLALLDAQRTLYAAQQALIGAQLVDAVNRVNLYKAVGGGG